MGAIDLSGMTPGQFPSWMLVVAVVLALMAFASEASGRDL